MDRKFWRDMMKAFNLFLLLVSMSSVVFLTGASSELGRALARLLATDGDSVALVARRQGPLEDLASEIRNDGGIAFPLVCDVSNRQDVRSAMERCENELGPIDCLIANAGIGGITGPENFDSTIVERIIQTNLVGPAYCIEQILPGMIARRKRPCGRY